MEVAAVAVFALGHAGDPLLHAAVGVAWSRDDGLVLVLVRGLARVLPPWRLDLVDGRCELGDGGGEDGDGVLARGARRGAVRVSRCEGGARRAGDVLVNLVVADSASQDALEDVRRFL